MLELIRYIHLNPLRANLVEDLKALDKYPWTGHSAILGRRKNPLIPETATNDSTSADRRIAFSQFRLGIEKATIPQNPVKPARAKIQAKPCPACPVGAKHRTGVQLNKKKRNL